MSASIRNAERRDRSDRQKRTCIGCGQVDGAETMVRLVVSEAGEVAVDLAGGAFGRGAHVHPSPRCLDGAGRGLAKSFKRAIAVTPAELAGAIVAAADRRVRGLLSSAARSNQVEIGADLAGEAFGTGKVALLVVARDAKSAASVGSVMHAIAQGGAVAWGTKEELGSLVNKSEVAVLGIVSQPIAAALRSVVTMASSVRERATAAEVR
jgi:predicted RNA-binding protein YlxR (DUF448 family)/ribosomal protein L7Ae-like RNA K-turn-binding protein